MKKWLSLVVACVLSLLLVSCGGNKQEPISSDTASSIYTSTTNESTSVESISEISGANTSVSLNTTTLKPSATTSKKTTTSRPPSTTAAPTPKTPYAADKLGFGIWGIVPQSNNEATPAMFRREVDRGYMNYYLLPSTASNTLFDSLRIVNETGGMAWLDMKTGYFQMNPKTGKNELVDGSRWKEDLDVLIQTLEGVGLWDNVAGFYIDEPMHSFIPADDLYEHTKYLRQKYKKRIYVNFCTNEFSTRWLPDMPREHITPAKAAYITDISFDAYGLSDPKEYRMANDAMKAAVGRSNEVRVWFIPCAFMNSENENYTEQRAINFLNMCYDLLKEEKLPGGIILYSWPTWRNGDSIEIGLQDTLRDGRFSNYDKVMLRVGKEIIKTKLK